MTSSNEPQLTRRELRELERLREQQAGTATPDAGGPAYAAPAAPIAPAPVAPAPAPAAPQPQYSQPVGVPQSAPQQMPAHPGQFSAPASAAPPVAAAPAPAPSFAPQQPTGGFAPPAPAVPVQSQPPFGTRPAAPPAPVPAAPQPAAPQAAAGPQPSAASAPERTLTRRELRAMLDGVPLDDFDDELDELDSSPLPAPGAPAAAPSPTFGGASAAAAHPQQQMPQRPGPAPVRPNAPVSAQPVAAAGATDSGSLNLPGVSAGAPGHWTSQLNVPDVEDRSEPFDQMLSRGGLSHGVPTTTNALILPSLPDQGSFANQLAQPGEVLATGSIDLPRSYGATGVHPSHVDSSEVDRLFEHQVEDVGTGVAPVAATRAISTQGAARTMIAPPKKEGMNVPLVLAVTAGVLALGVVGTLVIGAMTGLF